MIMPTPMLKVRNISASGTLPACSNGGWVGALRSVDTAAAAAAASTEKASAVSQCRALPWRARHAPTRRPPPPPRLPHLLHPLEERGDLPGGLADARRQALGHHAGDVLWEAAAGHVHKPADVGGCAGREGAAEGCAAVG